MWRLDLQEWQESQAVELPDDISPGQTGPRLREPQFWERASGESSCAVEPVKKCVETRENYGRG